MTYPAKLGSLCLSKSLSIKVLSILAPVGLLFGLAACENPVNNTGNNEQIGYRGTGMEHVTNAKYEAVKQALNQVPEPLYPPEEAGGPSSAEVYENVKVLGHLNELQFTRLMTHMTEWIVPKDIEDPDLAGCNYCHNPNGDFADDSRYTKTVARKMLQMTMNINTNWQPHVGNVGVTCYTCHRGNAIPGEGVPDLDGYGNDTIANLLVWATPEAQSNDGRALGFDAGQNHPTDMIGSTSLPENPFTLYLQGADEIRVNAENALPVGSVKPGIKSAEHTFALMIHMSKSLGVGCTTCHNTRAMADWSQSPPTRLTAWHGIRMARSINNDYMTPLTDVFPAIGYTGGARKGPNGDVLKVNCATCHQQVQKPLYGYPMLKDHPELWGKGLDYDLVAEKTDPISDSIKPSGSKISSGGSDR